jgi:hypothetical protein
MAIFEKPGYPHRSGITSCQASTAVSDNGAALLPPNPLRTVRVAFTVILLKLSECELHRTSTNRKPKDRLVDNAEHADSITGMHVFISHLCIFFSC